MFWCLIVFAFVCVFFVHCSSFALQVRLRCSLPCCFAVSVVLQFFVTLQFLLRCNFFCDEVIFALQFLCVAVCFALLFVFCNAKCSDGKVSIT